MAYFRCNGGASSSGVEFNKTLLGTGSDSSGEIPITLAHDYNDYDLIQFEYINTSNSSNSAFVTIPLELLNKAISLGDYFYIYSYPSTDRCILGKNSNTEFLFRGGASGNCYIKNIFGVKFDYKAKEILYDRVTPANTNVQPVIPTIEDFDILFGYMCDSTDTRPFVYPIWYINNIKSGIFQSGTSSIKVIYDSDGKLNSGKYMYIMGYKL